MKKLLVAVMAAVMALLSAGVATAQSGAPLGATGDPVHSESPEVQIIWATCGSFVIVFPDMSHVPPEDGLFIVRVVTESGQTYQIDSYDGGLEGYDVQPGVTDFEDQRIRLEVLYRGEVVAAEDWWFNDCYYEVLPTVRWLDRGELPADATVDLVLELADYSTWEERWGDTWEPAHDWTFDVTGRITSQRAVYRGDRELPMGWRVRVTGFDVDGWTCTASGDDRPVPGFLVDDPPVQGHEITIDCEQQPPATTPTTPPPTPASPPPSTPPPGPAPGSQTGGYWTVDRAGTVYAFGPAAHHGDRSGSCGPGSCPEAASIEATPSGQGYWVLESSGAVHAYGDAPALGSASHPTSAAPWRTLTATADGRGYWAFNAEGCVAARGTATFHGDRCGQPLNAPVIGSAVTPTGLGYWLVAADGGIFSFGDAAFWGSTGDMVLNAPVVGMAPAPDGEGYWLVASDGGIFSFGVAEYHGSMGGTPLNQPVASMVPSPTGGGYLLVATDGGLFAFGDVEFWGSLGDHPPAQPMVDVSPRP